MNFRAMTYIVLIFAALFAYAAYNVFLFWSAAQKSAPLIAATPPFNREDPSLSKSILVLGDSLAVGVGAPDKETIAARLATALHANIANVAKSGAHTSDLEGQLALAQKSRYDLILIQIGANDIIQLQSLAKAEGNMGRALAVAKGKSDRVVFFTAGDVGDAPLWPWPWKHIYSSKTRDLRTRFMALAGKYDALYVDLYAHGPIFASDPKRYYAVDDLHLTAQGYGKWFEIVLDDISKRWPDLVR